MAAFKFHVIETRNVEMIYYVEADSLEEAREKAESGDTTREEEVQFTGVTDRLIVN